MGLDRIQTNADDDLTPLTWLQDDNLLQNVTAPYERKHLNEVDGNEKVTNISEDTTIQCIPCSVPPIEYNPQVHVHTKPPFSFSALIFMAIESSECKSLPVKDIYSWIVSQFPYYQSAPSGWKNTVRHNLSLNKCFRKVDKSKEDPNLVGKGSLWSIDPELRPSLLESIRRTPAHVYPYMSAAKASFKSDCVQLISTPILVSCTTGQNLSSTIAKTNVIPVISSVNQRIVVPSAKPLFRGEFSITCTLSKQKTIGEKEAAAAESMLTLTQCSTAPNVVVLSNKSPPTFGGLGKVVVQNVPVIVSPSVDHNYSSAEKQSPTFVAEDANTTSSTSNQDSSDLSTSNDVIEECESDDDGVKGAEALLNLASRNKRRESSDIVQVKKIKVIRK